MPLWVPMAQVSQRFRMCSWVSLATPSLVARSRLTVLICCRFPPTNEPRLVCSWPCSIRSRSLASVSKNCLPRRFRPRVAMRRSFTPPLPLKQSASVWPHDFSIVPSMLISPVARRSATKRCNSQYCDPSSQFSMSSIRASTSMPFVRVHVA